MKKNIKSSQILLDNNEINIEYLDSRFMDHESWISGWLHNYVCPKCASMLSFHIDINEYENNDFICPNCGEHVSGEKYKEAWVYKYRQWFAENLILVVGNKEENALKYLVKYIDFYSENYSVFPEHGEKVGKGKIMAQSLDEAVFGVHLLRSIYYLKDIIPKDILDKWKSQLFIPMAEFLDPQGESIHNISVWIKCCIGMIGLVFDEKDLIKRVLNGDYGLYRQFDQGLTNDYIWREGSLHYHYYTLEALTYFCELYHNDSPKDIIMLILKEMYRAPMNLSFDRYHLPSLNDGWYPLTIVTYGLQIILAAHITHDQELMIQAETIISKNPHIIYNPQIAAIINMKSMGIDSYMDNHISVIRKPFNIMIKSGSIVPTHAHKDCLSIIIDSFSNDLGTPGYGSVINKTWYRSSLSHNCVSIDGKQNGNYLNNSISCLDSICRAEVTGSDSNDIVMAVRTLSVFNSEYIKDRTVIITKHEHVFDWTFHSECRLNHSEKIKSEKLLGDPEIYGFFEKVKRIEVNGNFNVEFINGDGRRLDLSIQNNNNMSIYVSKTPGNPANVKRNTILLRQSGKSAEFIVIYRLKDRKKEKSMKDLFIRRMIQ